MSNAQTTAYTPGPWHVADGGTSFYPLSVRAYNTEIVSFHSWDAKAKANAKLIAVAPELVDALSKLLLQAGHLEHNDPANYDFSYARMVLAAAGAVPEAIPQPAITFTQAEWDAIPADYKDVWTTERVDFPNWQQERHLYMGKRTLLRESALWVEGISFTIAP